MSDDVEHALIRARSFLLPTDPFSGCMIWCGAGASRKKYIRVVPATRGDAVKLTTRAPPPRFWFRGRLVNPRTLFYADWTNTDPDMVPPLTATCCNPLCCNPQHLKPTGRPKPPRPLPRPANAIAQTPTPQAVEALFNLRLDRKRELTQDEIDHVLSIVTPLPTTSSYEEVLPQLISYGPEPYMTPEMIMEGTFGIMITQDHLNRFFSENHPVGNDADE